ncbi:cyclase family protein [Cnuibacter physcomitrellae]|uniref:cyclase family protein n=1 Tax=Cnuibacter physcomitrellae TaxID=1619308 RepID=UPI002175CFF6|nr:cyclase family protein [Cnuibacter physcomitrellae]MCS5497330.1 cyclase family protein [Cnuibacter physcomitrellae]
MIVPRYDELLQADPPGSSWQVFGPDDHLGTINFLTPARVAEAARLIRTGRRFGLDHTLTAFEPYPTGTRRPLEHHLFSTNTWHRDDWVDSLYLQSSSQIDSLRHIGHPQHGFYNGLRPEENTADSSALGVHEWAEAGIAGRGVLLDVPRWFSLRGLPYAADQTLPIEATMLDEIAESEGVTWEGGEILLLRTGWAEQYLAKTPSQRTSTPWRQAPGLAQRESILRWLWDHEIALVAADNLAVEADPVLESDFRVPGEIPPTSGVDHGGMLHRPLIALLGMALGELWRLDELAADCAADGVYEFFVTCKPLNLVGAVGSPPNAIAFK